MSFENRTETPLRRPNPPLPPGPEMEIEAERPLAGSGSSGTVVFYLEALEVFYGSFRAVRGVARCHGRVRWLPSRS